jgi:hypothetical protein
MRIPFLFLFFISSFGAITQSTIVINEFMSNNADGMQEDSSQYYDWIELYNNSKKRINLKGYGISDDLDEPFKYVFSKVVIKPKSHLIVFASGKNFVNKKSIHLNFKINRFGEPLLLTSPNGEVLDKIGPISLVKNSSYGRSIDGQSIFERFYSPSPNASNNLVEGILFSHEQGFYPSEFGLELESKLEHKIHYTLDGSEPTAQSLLYTGQIEIQALVSDSSCLGYIKSSPMKIKIPENYFMGTIIRAASFKKGVITSQVYTKAYFITPSGRERYANIDVISLVTDPANLYNTKTGIYIGGVPRKFKQSDATYFKHGKAWERPAHVTLFSSDGSIGFEQGIGIRIHGGKGRKNPQKSFRLCARSEYGAQAINYPLFAMREHTVFKKVVLRHSMGGWHKTLIKDEVAAEICKDMNVDVLDSKPAILFLNGEYWGIYGIREYFDPDYIASNYNVKAKDVNIILHGYGNRIVKKDKNWGLLNGSGGTHGSLYQFLRTRSLAAAEQYAKLSRYLDIESIIDYYCIEIYFNNRDWPTNNNKLWSVGDGPWRQTLYDMDAGWSTNANKLNGLLEDDPKNRKHNKKYARFLIIHLMESPIFLEAFARRMSYLIENDFNIEHISEIVKKKEAIYEPYIEENIGRWGYPKTLRSWKRCINGLIVFNRNRPKVINQAFIDNLNISLDSIMAIN